MRASAREVLFRRALGQKIAVARASAKLSQDDVAERLAMSHSSVISRWENGEVTMSSYNFVRLKHMFRACGVQL